MQVDFAKSLHSFTGRPLFGRVTVGEEPLVVGDAGLSSFNTEGLDAGDVRGLGIDAGLSSFNVEGLVAGDVGLTVSLFGTTGDVASLFVDGVKFDILFFEIIILFSFNTC